MSETSGNGDDFSALISYTRSGETGQSASSTSDQEYDFLDFLGVAQSLKIDFLPITWQPALDKVGEGGTAKIRQALINIQTDFAFKRLEHPLFAEKGSRNLRALIAEISVLGHPAIRCHPNIMNIEGICWDVIDGGEEVWPVLVLEKAQLGDLNRFMASGPGQELDFNTRLDILFDVALAVRDLHAAGIIHGDIKHENILVFSGTEGRHAARVTDFGYSTLFATEDDLIKMPYSGIWTAPDLHHREILPKQARKMDVYSFGMLCLWLLFYNQTTNRDRNFKKDLEDSPMDPLYHVSELLQATPDLAIWERDNLQELFKLTLAQNPAERSAKFNDLLHLLLPYRAFYLTIPEDKIIIPHKGFEIIPSLPQLIQAHYSVRYYIAKCLEKKRDQLSISRCHTLNLAFCYELGFGVRRDIVNYSRTLLSTHGISIRDLEDLKDVIEQLKGCKQLPYIQNGLFRKFFEQGHFKAFDPSQQYREEQCSHEAKTHYQMEIATMGSILGDDHPIVQELRLQLFDLVSSEGRWKDAEELQSQIIDLELANEAQYPLKRHFGTHHQGKRFSGWTVGDGYQINGFRDAGRFAMYFSNLALTYFYQRRLTEAEELQVSLFDTFMNHFGLENLGTMTSISNLASTYSELGRWAEAEQLRYLVMQTTKKALGLKHPETLISMSNLAATYADQKRWKEAGKLLMKAIKTSSEILGTENPTTLAFKMGLAMIYSHQKKWGKAAELNEQVLKMQTRVLGAEHPTTLSSVRKLALIYSGQGQWKKGEELTIQTMKIGEKILGAEDSDTLTSMHNLALIYSHQEERLEEAEDLYIQVIETRKRILGAEHPDTLTSMKNLALVFLEQGRLEEAEELNMCIMKTSKRAFGAEHPETLTSMSNLALTYSQQDGRQKEAEGLLIQVMETRKRVLGAEHPDTLDSIDDLASTYLYQGRSETEESKMQEKWKKAEGLQVYVIETRKRVLGTEHPETLSSMRSLAEIYRDQIKYAENQEGFKKTEEVQVQLVEMSKRALGTEHPDTLRSMIDLAFTYKMQGRCEEAEESLTSMSNVLSTYKEQGRWEEAEELELEMMEPKEWTPRDHER